MKVFPHLRSINAYSWFKRLHYSILGFLLYHFFRKKPIVLILSSMRSGSTLLKALLSEAPEVEHLSEASFEVPHNKYFAYYYFYILSQGEIILVKKPPFYNNFAHYPILPKCKHKCVILVRNPVDTIISAHGMNVRNGGRVFPLERLIEYWAKTYENLLEKTENNNRIVVHYEDLIDRPLEITRQLFGFIGSKKTEGVNTYGHPSNGEWTWGLDDGGENIRRLEVVELEKDYSEFEHLIPQILGSSRVNKLINQYDIKMPANLRI